MGKRIGNTASRNISGTMSCKHVTYHQSMQYLRFSRVFQECSWMQRSARIDPSKTTRTQEIRAHIVHQIHQIRSSIHAHGAHEETIDLGYIRRRERDEDVTWMRSFLTMNAAGLPGAWILKIKDQLTVGFECILRFVDHSCTAGRRREPSIVLVVSCTGHNEQAGTVSFLPHIFTSISVFELCRFSTFFLKIFWK